MRDSSSFSPLSIATLNRLVRERLESGFPLCWVAGEISNLTIAASGHAYFTLKDENAQVRCVMFRGRSQLLGWRLANGQHVEARVLVTLYEARGDFQLNVEAMRRAGVGNLFEQFQKLKARLEAEGLFSAETKRPLPGFPVRIGIVTSLQAAALRDVLTTLARRSPHVSVTIFPTAVQGDGAAAQIAGAIGTAGGSGNGLDVLILCRGGGSMEDLWAFNDEAVARAIRACPVPVVSGIGHETDFTIADFAADLRAPTPTAAAEIVAPGRAPLHDRLGGLHGTLHRLLQRAFERHSQHLDGLARRLVHPARKLQRQQETLHHLHARLAAAMRRQQALSDIRLARMRQRFLPLRPKTETLARRRDQLAARLAHARDTQHANRVSTLARLASSLRHLDPGAVLGRGYALVRDARGQIVRDAAAMEPSDAIHVYLAHGRIDARVTDTEPADSLDTGNV